MTSVRESPSPLATTPGLVFHGVSFDPANRTVSMRNVDVLRFDQATVAVSGGLDTGEVVVTAGVQALHPGQKVRLLGAGP